MECVQRRGLVCGSIMGHCDSEGLQSLCKPFSNGDSFIEFHGSARSCVVIQRAKA